jgi:hypothetical protein
LLLVSFNVSESLPQMLIYELRDEDFIFS